MTECDVCNDFNLLAKATCDEKAYRWSVVKTLCFILSTLQDEEVNTLPDTIILPQVVKAAADVPSSYASVGLISSAKKLNYIRVVNTTDADIEFSYDGGGVTAFTVLAKTEYKEELNITFSLNSALQMRMVSGQTASFGRVIIEGRYDGSPTS